MLTTSLGKKTTNKMNIKKQQKRERSATIVVNSSKGDDTLKNLESLLPEDDNERLQKEREREAEEKYREKEEQKRLADDLASAIKNQQKNKKNLFTMNDDGEYDFSQKSIAALCYICLLYTSDAADE